MEDDAMNPVEIPIEGELDLHTFRPADVKTLVPEYLRECLRRGIRNVRIVHGKGTGALRRTVHSVLDEDPLVASYRLDSGPSGWGCTVVTLKQADE